MIFADLYTQKQTLRWNTRAGSLVGNTITITVATTAALSSTTSSRAGTTKKASSGVETKG